MNPYEALGVAKDATADEIRAAYRKLAKKHHPDKGGDKERMAAINDAYAVLSDPNRRKRYDDTGKTDETDIDAEVRQVITVAFNKVIDNNDLDRGIDAVIDVVQQAYNKISGDIDLAKSARGKLEVRRDRFRTKDGENIYHTIIDARIAQIDQSMKVMGHRLKVCDLALKELDKYEGEAQTFTTRFLLQPSAANSLGDPFANIKF